MKGARLQRVNTALRLVGTLTVYTDFRCRFQVLIPAGDQARFDRLDQATSDERRILDPKARQNRSE